MEKGKLDEAIGTLKKYIVAKPNLTDAFSHLQQIYWRKSDNPRIPRCDRDTLPAPPESPGSRCCTRGL
jgi:hypothetical protein